MGSSSKNAKAKTPAPAMSAPSKGNWFSRMALWKKIVICLVIVGIILFFIINAATNPSVKVSNEFLNDIQANRADAAYALMTTDAQGTVTKEDFRAIVAQIGPILNAKESMKSKRVTGETGSAATAKVVYEIKGTDGVTYSFTNNLIKDNGQWRVLNFESKKK